MNWFEQANKWLRRHQFWYWIFLLLTCVFIVVAEIFILIKLDK